MSIINSDASVAINIINSAQINHDIDQWLQAGGQVKQLDCTQHNSLPRNFNNGHMQGMCELRASAKQYSSVTERREIIFNYVLKHPKSSCNAISTHLKIWQGHVTKDLQVLRKKTRIYHERIGLVYYYSAATSGDSSND